MRRSALLLRQPIPRVLWRGRQRAAALAGSIPNEAVVDFVHDLRQEAAPLIERATGRSRRRRRGRAVALLLGAIALAAGVCYLLWRRRDEQPAYLVEEPDRPYVAPAGSPSPAPESPAPTPEPHVDSPSLSTAGQHEFVGAAGALGQRETREARELRESRDPHAHDAGSSLPSTAPRAPFAARKDQLPRAPKPSLPH